METIELVTSRTGLKCLWEKGGAGRNTGYSAIICDNNGEAKKAIYVRTKGHIANSHHALIPVCSGDIMVEVNRHRKVAFMYIWCITSVEFAEATLELISRFDGNVWDNVKAAEIYKEAIDAAVAKSEEYHCRVPFYISNSDE